MAAPKGNKYAKSRKGKPNKLTAEVKEWYSKFLSGQIINMEKAADELLKKDPYQYLMVMDKMSQKVIPNKKDITSDDKSIVPNVTITERRDKSE